MRHPHVTLILAALAGLILVARGSAGGLPPVPVPPENPITEGKRVLGKILFWDVQLSSDNTVACGTCHQPTSGGADSRIGVHPGFDGVFDTDDDVFGSPGMMRRDARGDYEPDPVFGFEPQVTRRAANSFLLAQFDPELFWDGRAPSAFTDPLSGATLIPSGGALESQSIVPILSSVEMARADRTWDDVTSKLVVARPLALATDLPPDVAQALERDATYPALFESAFGTPEITPARMAFALATYERTVVPDQTPFDTDTMTPQQELGFDAFMDAQARCRDCHPPPLFADATFRNIGLRPWAEDAGRMEVSEAFEDRGLFKVPGLRNVGLRETFMHHGRHPDLQLVMDFYREVNGQEHEEDNLDPLMPIISVPAPKVPRIIEFMTTALTDPRAAAGTFPFDRPTLHTELAANPGAIGAARAGTGGIEPRLLLHSPPNIGNAEFTVGLTDGRGGAEAWLAWSLRPPGADGVLTPQKMVGPFSLGGIEREAGAGYATWAWPIPDDPSMLGDDVYVQWRVDDPEAADGIALSRVAWISLFLDDPTQCTACPGDMNCDGTVDTIDLAQLLDAWDASGGEADLDRDGTVGAGDLAMLLDAWGACRGG